MTNHPSRPLSAAEIEHFVRDGFVRLDEAFPRPLAETGRAILWRETGCDPEDPAAWTEPVIRLGMHAEQPFRDATGSPVLAAAFDQLVGPGRWRPMRALGTFPIRFPSPKDPGDAGWHIDVSFGTETSDFLQWRANIASRARALLVLFLFSAIDPADAPTRIRAGSHRDIARRLAPAGEMGLTLGELAATGFEESAHRREVAATGPAGAVYLCHPFLMHAAQPHRGGQVRFIAQPPLEPTAGLDPTYPLGRAIAAALSGVD